MPGTLSGGGGGASSSISDAALRLPTSTAQRLLDEKLRETIGDPLKFWTLMLSELQSGAGLTPDTTAKLIELAETRVADYVMKKLHDDDNAKRQQEQMRLEAERAKAQMVARAHAHAHYPPLAGADSYYDALSKDRTIYAPDKHIELIEAAVSADPTASLGVKAAVAKLFGRS